MAEDEGFAGKAEVIAVGRLSEAIMAATRDVSSKHNVGLAGNLIMKPGTLIGRYLKELIALEEAQKLASEITAQVQRAGVSGPGAKLSPSVLFTDGRILAGYFPSQPEFEVQAVGG